MKRPARRTVILGRSTLLKVASALIVLAMLSTTVPSSGRDDLSVRTTALVAPFSTPVMVNDVGTNDQALPVIVATPNNGLFVVWQDSRSGNEDMYFSRSFDNGTTFAANKRADDSIRSSKQIEPAVAVSGNGTILLAWQDNRKSNFDYDIYFTKSYDGGVTFAGNVKADDSTGVISWQERPSIAVLSGGGIYVAWTDDRSGLLRVRGAYSTDDGATFSPSEEIAPAGSGSTSGQAGVVLAASGKRIFAAFMDNVTGTPHPYLCVSTNGGKSFGAPVRLDNTGSSAISQRDVAIAPVPGGGVVAAWEDSRNGGWDIYASIVSSHGTIIASDLRVDDDSTGAAQTKPSVAADQLGNIYAAWIDSRDGTNTAIRFSCLGVGNASFNRSVEVSRPGGMDYQRMPSIIATEPGRVFVVWQDDKAGTYDVYLSRAYFPGLFGLSLAVGWNLVSIPSVGHGYKASTLGLKNGSIVSEWDSTTQTYSRTYIVGKSLPISDFSLSANTGYWIFVSAHDRINLKGSIPTAKQYRYLVVPMGGGWVIVGFESLNTTRYASDIPKMLDNGGSVKLVSSFDPASGNFTSYITGRSFTDFVLAPGHAYFCFCTASATLSYTP